MNRRNKRYEIVLTILTLISIGMWVLCFYLSDPALEFPAMWGFTLLCCTFTVSAINGLHVVLYLEDVT